MYSALAGACKYSIREKAENDNGFCRQGTGRREVGKMLRKIYLELVAIKKELQTIRRSLEPKMLNVDAVSHQIQECLTEQIGECVDSVPTKV